MTFILGILSYSLYSSYRISNQESITINSFSDFSYGKFQLKYNPKYFATSGDMLTPYDTLGGMAPPVLTFTPKKQAFSYEGNDYISIYSTLGFDSFEDWIDLLNSDLDYNVINEWEIDKEDFIISKKSIEIEGTNPSILFIAYISLPERTSYFFECGSAVSEKDFDQMLNSFKIREFAEME